MDLTLNKYRKKEAFSGKLLKGSKSGITEHTFNYEIVNDRSYATGASSMAVDYVSVTEVIKTSYISLPFARGDKVVLHDNRTMTVQGVQEYHNPKKALQQLPSLERYTLILEGGGK